jgi:peptidoglycan/xylan/chitin deacetylase (PgdA/CDA1 family)
MARLLGPDTARRTVTQVVGSNVYDFSGRAATVYLDEALTQLADIATYDPANPTVVGTSIPSSQVTLSARNSRLPQFWFPDNVDQLYVSVNGLSHVWMVEADVDSRLDYQITTSAPYPIAAAKVTNNVTSMQSGHGWVAAGTSANNLNDTSVFVLGSQSAAMTTQSNGSAATLTKTGLSLDISATKQLRVLVRVDGVDNLQGLSLYVSSDGMVANFGILNIQSVTPDPAVRWLKDGEWKWVTLNWQSAVVTGTPNLAAIDSLRIRATATNATTFQVRLQAVQVIERKSYASGGIVCFTYDDSYGSQYTVAKPKLDQYGYSGTAYTIVSNVAAGDAGNSLYLTTAQLKAMKRYSGWEIGPHAMTVTNHNRGFAGTGTPLTAAELDADIRGNIQWLKDNGLSDGFMGHCYPQGKYTTAVEQQMAGRVAYARAMTATANAAETVPPADPYAIRCYTLDNNSVLGTLQAQVDGCAASGGLLVYCCHEIVTTPTTSTQFSTANHTGLVDYVAGKAGIRVMTLGDVMRSLSAQ